MIYQALFVLVCLPISQHMGNSRTPQKNFTYASFMFAFICSFKVNKFTSSKIIIIRLFLNLSILVIYSTITLRPLKYFQCTKIYIFNLINSKIGLYSVFFLFWPLIMPSFLKILVINLSFQLKTVITTNNSVDPTLLADVSISLESALSELFSN